MPMTAAGRKRVSIAMKERHRMKRGVNGNGDHAPAAAEMDPPFNTLEEPSSPFTKSEVYLLSDVVTREAQRRMEFLKDEVDVEQTQALLSLKLRLLKLIS